MYRAIQWATGQVGSFTLKATIEHPDLELVGVKVFDPAKHGKDAGDLVGLSATGVHATTSVDEILALDADVVLHSPRGGTLDERDGDVMALLRSGKNVISCVAYAMPEAHGADYAKKLHDAGLDGGASLLGTGINPDLTCSRIPAGLTQMCTDVKRIRMSEAAYMGNNPHVVTVGGHPIGKEPEEREVDPARGQPLGFFAMEPMQLLAHHLQVELDDIRVTRDLALATHDFETARTSVKKGTVAGAHIGVTGVGGGEDFLTMNWYWFVEKGLPGYPVPKEEYQWAIDIDGKPAIQTVIDVTTIDTPWVTFNDDPGFYVTAAPMIRAIPAVVAAPPGLFKAPVFAPWTPRMPAPSSAV